MTDAPEPQRQRARQREAAQLRARIEDTRKFTIIGVPICIDIPQPPHHIHGEIERLEWQLKEVQYRRFIINKVG
ncbi:hypothetical protein [Nocardiopsis rhodophaea]|uniref:hypothetical protein n=1 Tax=Nocardiopsis rhodophaea TaxID=280238 RepID=UPI0031D06C66